ncbi:MAG: glucose-6-phosphate isomerase [Candidatus Aegiribacteria sp.]
MNSEVSFLDFEAGFDHPPLADKVLADFSRWEDQGRLGFMDLPDDSELLQDSIRLADEMRAYCCGMVAAGIGGSSLGLRALLDAFTVDPSVILADSPDSAFLSRLTREMDPDDSCLTVITKSGSTAETMAIFLSLYPWIETAGDSGRRIVAVTDPVKGDLRKLADSRGWPSLPVPPSVGGRFSVMSPVGLFPAAFAGIDVTSLVAGAGAVVRDFRNRGADSLAARTASAFLANFHSRPVHAFFAYDNRLYSTALWFSQLWAESLGKKHDLSGEVVHTGQTPLACRGPADQHSLVQLFMEGPPDKTVTIVTTPPMDDAPVLPGGFDDLPSISYLEGLEADRLREVEAEATGKALEERGIPVCRIRMGALDERSLGGLMMVLEVATVLCGLALNVDPLDQPGVERGKVLTYSALGRPGY